MMAQPPQARFILSGHGFPIAQNDVKYVPPNGQMIRMIPGTCPPVQSIARANSSLFRNPNQPASEILNTLNTVDTTQTNAFHLYDSNQPYSDLYVYFTLPTVATSGEDGKLQEYVYDSRYHALSVNDKTDALRPIMQIREGSHAVRLSDVNELIGRYYPSYLLIVVACVSTGSVVMDQLIQNSVKETTIPEVMSRLARDGFAGGKKGKKSLKKRRNRKTTQRKKKHVTKRR